jgi:hypothetical protein
VNGGRFEGAVAGLTPHSSGRVRDRVPSSIAGVRAAQLYHQAARRCHGND